jgi:selenium metabolism protein YedF
MKTLDMRGNPCPIPVVNAKKALAEQGAEGVEVLVDNFVAVQNLEKMAKGSGYDFSYTEEGASVYRARVVKGAASCQADQTSPSAPPAVKSDGSGLVVLITSDSMGRGAEELGRLLIKGFLFSLTQLNPAPSSLIFLNGGARLTTGGANTVADLKALEEKGANIYTCGTCANYYKLTDSLAVGSIVDMMRITNLLDQASRIITI